MRTYYGMTFDEDNRHRSIFATITGQMSDGTLVYTECEQTKDGAVAKDGNGDPKLILDNQFTRHLKHGMQTFARL